MKIILYVFSGTGNTYRVSQLYQKYFSKLNDHNQVDIYRITQQNQTIPHPKEYDLIGIGYPIHAFCAPEPIIQFCKQLPAVQKKKTFFFKTSGEGLHLNDCSSQKCLKIISKKGYDVIMEKHIVMPYNMIYRHKDVMAKQMWIYAHAIADLNCRELTKLYENNQKTKVKRTILKRMWTNPIGWIERRFAHLHGTCFKVDQKKCIHCNQCVKNCSQNNISIQNGKYKFGHKCVLCMGCSFTCPQDAIHIGIFKFWKVHGSYHLNHLMQDETLEFPYVPNHAKGIYRIYKKYYREMNQQLEKANINIYDYIYKEKDHEVL